MENELWNAKRKALQDAAIKAAMDLCEHMQCQEFSLPIPVEGLVLTMGEKREDVQAAVPDGYVLMPANHLPKEMEAAAAEAAKEYMQRTGGNCMKTIYQALVNHAKGAPAPAEKPDLRLDAPAQVGHTKFGSGIRWSTVIKRAQREYRYQQEPKPSAEAIAKAKDEFNSLFGISPAEKAPSYDPCGGCGNSDPQKRCIGCGHPFDVVPQPDTGEQDPDRGHYLHLDSSPAEDAEPDLDTGGFDSIDLLIGYCDEHRTAPRPMFSGRQLNALIAAAGNPDLWVKAETGYVLKPDEWYDISPFFDEFGELCRMARERREGKAND
jgi:hypothetical protein